MAQSYSGREWGCLLGITTTVGVGTDTADANAVSGSKVQFRVTNPVSDFAWDGGFNRTEIERAGRRTLMAEDIVNHYGSGVWTWDFDYPVDNEIAIQNLLQLIYPANGATTTALTIPAAPTVQDYSHGSTAGNDKVAFIILQNPLAAKDHYMHSAVLQNLTMSMSADVNAGLLNMSGQFMSGYKPIMEANTVAVDTSAADFPDTNKGTIFDLTTRSFGGSTVTLKSFDLTIENPATRVGFQGASGECDGYTRAAPVKVTGNISLKADSTVQGFLESKYHGNTNVAITLENGVDNSKFSFSIPSANISSMAFDQADEGIFADVAFTGTSGAAGSGNLAVIKCT